MTYLNPRIYLKVFIYICKDPVIGWIMFSPNLCAEALTSGISECDHIWR